MSMFSLELTGQAPFKKVLINSLVADEHGQKMSKSKGNVVDPLAKIDTIGADALRFALMGIESQTRYISLSDERMETASAFWTRANDYFNGCGITVLRVLTDNGAPYRSKLFAQTLGPITHK